MATTTPDTLSEDNRRYFQFARNTFPDTATEDALTVKTIYDVRRYETIVIRVRNTDGAFSLDYYVDGSVLEVPDDTSPASDWFVIDDIDGTTLTNIALANSTDANRIIDVSYLSFLRVKTENTTGGQVAEVGIDVTASVKIV